MNRVDYESKIAAANSNPKKIHLNIGEVHITQKPSIVWTILGSCIALVFFNRRLQTGGICHAQLPERKRHYEGCDKTCPVRCSHKKPNFERFKYVTCAAQYMLEQFYSYGIRKNEIEVKLFGGANVFQAKDIGKTVGAQNLKTAMDFIQHHNLNLTNKHTGGNTGVTIYFHTHTGKVFLRRHLKTGTI